MDIFDGGPTMTARTASVASIKGAHRGRVGSAELDKGEKALIATGRLVDFRCCYGARAIEGDTVVIDAQAAEILRVGEGDEVWSVGR